MAWLAPDNVLPRALRIVLAHATGPSRVCLARDARGRVRVALQQRTAADPDRLASALSAELGAWFVGPIVDGSGSRAHRRIASELFRMAGAWPAGWPTLVQTATGTDIPIPAWLVGYVVVKSKESWLRRAAAASAGSPRVVSFYSFKGGVGRTTTLGCVAARLVERGLKVVAIDLDLEAPGLGSFLGAQASTGVIDHVLSHVATGVVGDVEPEPVDGFANLSVVAAGAIGLGYLEKIARLDYLSTASGAGTSPTEQALRALIDAIAARLAPDLILLDARAGIHDLGGLALHRLSHADVLVARANAQAQVGMRLVLDAMRRMRSPDERDLRLVQTMVPMPFDSDISRPLVESWRQQMYEACMATIYSDLTDDAPALEHEAAHYPLLIGAREELTRTDRLTEIPREMLPHYDRIADVVVEEDS